MITAAPREIYGEWTEEVKQGPSQDNNIVEIKEHHNHLGSIPNPYKKKKINQEQKLHVENKFTGPSQIKICKV